MGGDHGPSVTVPGVQRATKFLPGARFLLHGDPAAIGAVLDKLPDMKAVCEVRPRTSSSAWT